MKDGSFWQNIPAAMYVLFGVIISGVFTFVSTIINNKNNRELKELENQNSKELKEMENQNNKEVQTLDITHKEKLQELKEKNDRELRLLDRKIKVFSDFHNNYSGILLGGAIETRLDKIGELRKTAYKVRLLVSVLKDGLSALDTKLVGYETLIFNIKNGKDTRPESKQDEEIKNFVDEIHEIILPIFDSLSSKL